MKITTTRGHIKDAVGGIGKVVNGKQSLPVLGCVRLRVSGDQAIAEATDLDQLIEYRFEGAEIQGEGTCILPVSTLKDLSKGGKSEQVEIEAQDPLRISVTNHVGGHAVNQTVQGMPPDEWPSMHVDMPTQPAGEFLETYRRLVPFASTDETRYVINSVFVEVGKGEKPVTMVSTDGRRLACFNSMALPIQKSVVVPITKFLGWKGLGTDVEIGVCEEDDRTWLGVRSERFFYAVKTVDGTYPNYRQVIPTEPGEHIVTFADSDVDLLKQALPTFPGGEDVTIVGQNGHVTLYGRGPEDNTWSALQLENTSYTGNRSYIGLNRQYVLDALVAGFREFAITDELCPVLSRTTNNSGVFVLMPMRVSDPEDKGESGTKRPTDTPATTDDENDGVPVEQREPAPPQTTHEPKRRNTVTKQSDQKNAEPAWERVIAACDESKTRVREAAHALTALSQAIKAFEREQKTKEREIEQAKAAIAKVQSIKLAA